MKNLKIISGMFCLSLLLSTAPTYAFNAFGGVNCSNASSSAVCSDASQPASNVISGSNSLIAKATNIIAIIAGIVAVIVVLIGSFELIASGGSPEKIDVARRTITYALIGIVVIVLAKVILYYTVANG